MSTENKDRTWPEKMADAPGSTYGPWQAFEQQKWKHEPPQVSTETPRTDAEVERRRKIWNEMAEIDWPAFPESCLDFARQLERELSRVTEERNRLKADFEQAAQNAKTNASLLNRTMIERDSALRRAEEFTQALRYIFYYRSALGAKVSDMMMEEEPARWEAVYQLLNPEFKKGSAAEKGWR